MIKRLLSSRGRKKTPNLLRAILWYIVLIIFITLVYLIFKNLDNLSAIFWFIFFSVILILIIWVGFNFEGGE